MDNTLISRRKYDLRFLLAIIAVICIALSFRYPRIYCSVTIDMHNNFISAPDRSSVLVKLARSARIRQLVRESDAQSAALLDQRGDNWLTRHLFVVDLGKDEFEIRVTGMPTEKARLRRLVDCIADQFVEVCQQNVDRKKRALEVLVDSRKATIESLASRTRREFREPLESSLVWLDAKINSLDQERTGFELPEILSRSTGFDF